MELFGETLAFGAAFFLLLALALALAFEFVNGFHDTANAVATVIYTNTLKPVVAVVWSGCWNLLGALGFVGWVFGYFGVVIGGSAVAYSIDSLLPVELVLNSGSGAGFAMMEAVLLLATVAQRYDMQLAPNQKVRMLPSVTLRPRHGVRMILHHR